MTPRFSFGSFGTAETRWRFEPKSRCLDPSSTRGRPLPVLKFAYTKTVIIEVNTWFSQQVMAYAFAILAHELLGYKVVFNHVDNTGARLCF